MVGKCAAPFPALLSSPLEKKLRTGARAPAMAPEPVGIVNGMARNQQTDVPAIVLHALIGNVRPTVLFLCHIWTWLTLVLAQTGRVQRPPRPGLHDDGGQVRRRGE